MEESFTLKNKVAILVGIIFFIIICSLIFIIPAVQADSIDTEPPSIPANLSSTFISTTSVGLVWEPLMDNVGVTGYEIYNGQDLAQTVTGTSFTISGLQPLTAYIFTVKARDEAGNVSGPSNAVSATTQMEAPADFTAKPLDSMVTLKWTAVTGASAYYLLVDGNQIDNGSSTTYIHSGLSPNTSHTYKVKAINSFGDSGWSDSISVNTLKIVNINGTISTNIVWTADTVYFVQSDLTIAQSAHLQIMPGAVVRFFQMTKLIVYGKVSAIGTQTNNIVFTGYIDTTYGGSGGGSYWSGIYIANTGEFNCEFSIFRYSGCYNFTNLHTIFYNEGKLIVKNSDISRMWNIAAYLTASSDSTIEGSHIINIRGAAIQVKTTGNAKLSIKNNSIDGCIEEGIRISQFGTGSVDISGNNITNCGKYPVYVNLNGLGSSVFYGISNNTFTGNIYMQEAFNAIYVEGTTTCDVVLTRNNYIVQRVVISQGNSMFLQPGVVLRVYYNGQNITVNGVLQIEGTENEPVILTTYKDIEYGGAGLGSLYDYWDGLLINSTGSVHGNYLKLKYAGYAQYSFAIEANGELDLSNSEIIKPFYYGINVNSSRDISLKNTEIDAQKTNIIINMSGAGNLAIQDCIIGNSSGSAIDIEQYGIGDVHIERNRFKNIDNIPFLVKLDGLGSSIFSGISDNIFENTVYNGTIYDSVVLSNSPKVDIQLSANKYYSSTSITIPQNVNFIMQAGAILRLEGSPYRLLTINGKMEAMGTLQQPIILTSYDDSKYGNPDATFGCWGGIKVGTTGELTGEYMQLRYGQNFNYLNYNSLMVYGKLSLVNSQIYKANQCGICFYTAIEPVLKFNSFVGNEKAINNASPSAITVDATMNYWGSVFGPQKNENSVSSGVEYDPWLGREQSVKFQFGRPGVFAPTGNFSKTCTDLKFPSPGFMVDLVRTYNSRRGDIDGFMGRGWTFNYQCRVTDYGLSWTPMKQVNLPDGSAQCFIEQEDGTYFAENSRNILNRNTDGTYLLKTPSQYQYLFDANGYLGSITDRNGNTLTIHTDSAGRITFINDQVSRYFSFAYQDGLLRTVTDPAGRTVTYEYENSLLARVISPIGSITRYTYDSSGYLNEVRDTDTKLLESIIYDHTQGDNQHKVSQITDSYGNIQVYSYDNINKKATITDSSGREDVYWYDDSMFLTSHRDPEGKLTSNTYELDENGFNKFGDVKEATDRNGNVAKYTRDTHGNILTVTNPDNSTKVFTYDTEDNLISEKDENGKFTYYIFDEAKKNLLKKVQPFNGTDTYPQDDATKFAITTYTYYTYSDVNKPQGSVHTITDPNGNVTTYGYDNYGNMNSFTDQAGNTTINSYNSYGLPYISTTPGNKETEFSYDAEGRLTKQVVNNTETIRIVYDTEGRKVKEISPKLYDSALEDPLNNTYSGNLGNIYTYYDNGKVHTVTNAENQVITYTYDSYGNVLTETKPNGSINSYEYDVMNRVVKTWFKDDANATPVLMEENTYLILADKKTQVISKKYIGSTSYLTTTSTYNYADKPVTQKYNDNSTSSTTYTLNGLVLTETDPKGNITSYTYDGLNRLKEKKIPFESISGTIYYTLQQHTYDANGNIKTDSITNNLPGQAQAFSTTQYDYNSLNQLVIVTTTDGGSPENYTQYYYDADGNKVRMYTGLSSPLIINGLDNVTPNGDTEYSVTKYLYDTYERLIQMTDPLNQTESYQYDQNGKLESETDRNGNITTMAYDNLDRVKLKSVACSDTAKNSSYVYTYDSVGNLETTSGGGILVSYIYDKMGRLNSETDSTGVSKEYTYDLLGSRSTFKLKKNGTVKTDMSYTYNNMGRLYQVMNSTTVEATYLYDLNGNRSTLTYYNDNSTTYTYNLNNRLNVLTNKKGMTTLSQYTYAYYLDGNQASKTNHAGTATNYIYDGLGRLSSETVTSGTAISYTYDDFNNRATMLVTGGAINYSVSYLYDGNNRLVTETKTTNGTDQLTTCGYDNNGNQTSKGSNTYVYDGLNRLTAATENGQNITYTYNADDLRRSKTVNGVTAIHVWDGQEMVAEFDGSGLLTDRYIRGINLVFADNGSGTNKTYYLNNGHGDVIQLTSSTGSAIKAYDYDAFGNEKSPVFTDTNKFRYCGEYFDKETGTYYLRARYYDPTIGRFITEDSYSGKAEDPLSLNLYTYCGNNPVMYIDPTGHTFWDVIGGLAKSLDETLTLGIGCWNIDYVKYNLGVQTNNWDYLYRNNEDYRFGYTVGNVLGLGFGVKSLGNGLSLLSTQKGVALVTSTGEIVQVVSGTVEGIIESAKGLAITFMAGKDNGNDLGGLVKGKPEIPKGAEQVRNDQAKVKSQEFKDFIRDKGQSFKENEWVYKMETWELQDGSTMERHYWLNKKTGEAYYHE
jgi:RHS repeat-associated protein